MLIAKWMPLILLLSLTGPIAAQQSQTQAPPPADHQQDSLAAAAHRARQAKKDEPKPVKVWDNDTLASSSGVISVVGQPVAPAANSAPASDAKSATATPTTAEKKSGLEADLNAAKASLQSLKVDLDILQRKYAMDQQTYYGKTDYASDKAGAAALADEKNQIDSKQQQVTDAEKKVADLQAELDDANKSSK